MEERERIASDQEIDFCTLGMLIIDEIHYLPPQKSVYNVLGGAGTYSALGARIFSPTPLSKTVGWVVDKGSDFPPSISKLIASWKTSALIRHDASRLTTRGWNGYDASETRDFKYATPKLRLTASSLSSSPALLRSKSFHLICSPSRCIDLVNTITQARSRLTPSPRRPLFVWEPVPDLCIPDELLNTTRALAYVDVCSPNHDELAALMSYPSKGPDKEFIQTAAEQLLESVPGSSIALVIRCGSAGCYVAQNGGRTTKRKLYTSPKSKLKQKPKTKKLHGTVLSVASPTDLMSLFAHLEELEDSLEHVNLEDDDAPEPDWGISSWTPSYHQSADVVVDPTGAGNTFLGALSVALARGIGVEEAARWGTVAASLAIEQVGMPVLGVDGTGQETWNGIVVQDRLEEFEIRLGLRVFSSK